MLLPQDSTGFVVCSKISTSNGSVLWKFPCVSYKRDAETIQEDYNMQSLGKTLASCNSKRSCFQETINLQLYQVRKRNSGYRNWRMLVGS